MDSSRDVLPYLEVWRGGVGRSDSLVSGPIDLSKTPTSIAWQDRDSNWWLPDLKVRRLASMLHIMIEKLRAVYRYFTTTHKSGTIWGMKNYCKTSSNFIDGLHKNSGWRLLHWNVFNISYGSFYKYIFYWDYFKIIALFRHYFECTYKGHTLMCIHISWICLASFNCKTPFVQCT